MRKIVFFYIVHLLINSSIIMGNQAQNKLSEKNTNALEEIPYNLQSDESQKSSADKMGKLNFVYHYTLVSFFYR